MVLYATTYITEIKFWTLRFSESVGKQLDDYLFVPSTIDIHFDCLLEWKNKSMDACTG